MISMFMMLFFLISEIYSYQFPEIKSHLEIELLSQEHYILITVNISFFSIPCNSLITYYTDSTQDHFTFYSLDRSVLDSEGNNIHNLPRSLIIDEKTEDCGSCYGAEENKYHCCNNCADVMEAYAKKKWRPPQFSSISQCKKFLLDEIPQGQGCLLSGDLKVKKIPGSIHFTNTLQYNPHLNQHTNINGFHQVHSFIFKDPNSTFPQLVGPVDGVKITRGTNTNYFFKIMPAVNSKGRFYESSSNYLVLERHMNPEVLFTYDIEPITTIYDEEGKRFTEFLVSVCAIIGGWYAITLLIAKFIVK